MEWEQLISSDQLEEINKKSHDKPVIIFKHSTRCSISAMALGRFERSFDKDAGFEPYFLDLIANREVSNKVAELYKVHHQSPQVVLILKGEAIYNASHNAISFDDIKDSIKN